MKKSKSSFSLVNPQKTRIGCKKYKLNKTKLFS